MTLEARRMVRLERLAPLLVGGMAFAVATWASRVYAVGVFHDDGVYAILAKSLATGEGYRYLHIPGAPVATHYPPGYPLVLAALWRLAPAFPQNVGVFLFANALLLSVTAWSTMSFARRVFGWQQGAAIAAAIVATLSYPLLLLSGLVLSEPLFAAVLLPALIASEHLAGNESRDVEAVLVGAAGGALTLVRSHGVTLVFAIVLVLVARKRWRMAALSVVAALVVVSPWQIWVALHDAALAEPLRGSYGSYAAWLADGLRGGMSFVGATIAANVREIGALLADRYSLSDHALPRALTSVATIAFMLWGAARSWRRAPVTVVFLAAYVGIVLVWPFTPWRFVYAMWPLAVLLLGQAIHRLFALRASRPVAAAIGLSAAALLALGGLHQEMRAYGSRSWQAPAQAATAQIAPLVQWVTSSTRPGDLVAVDGEQLVYLFTGRRAVPVVQFTATEYVEPRSVAQNAASLEQLLAAFPVHFVLTISPALYASADLVARNSTSAKASSPRLVPIGRIAGGGVFRVERLDSLPAYR